VKSGDEVTTGQVVPYATATECFDAVLQRIDWKNRSYDTPARTEARLRHQHCLLRSRLRRRIPDASRARCRLTPTASGGYSGACDVGQGLII